jgi:AraC-like DNA-binding protein
MGIAASPTIREALKLVLRFQPIIFPGAEYTVEDAAGRTAISASLAIPKSPGAMHLLADVWSTAAVAILRPLCGVQSPFVEVSLPRPEPGTIRAWTSALGTTPVFGAPVASLTFDPALLDRPSYCEQYCEELLGKQRRQHGSVALVRSQMFAYGGRVPSMEQLARDLRISDRTLHRILAAEDSSYRQLRDEVRLVLAQRLLNRPGLTIAQVATALGYDHPPSFTRAYRRWTGRNPSTGRET